MPIYEYVCQGCEHAFEVFVQGAKKAACPACGSGELQKQFSAFAVTGQGAGTPARPPGGACSTCGDPRGAGACALN